MSVSSLSFLKVFLFFGLLCVFSSSPLNGQQSVEDQLKREVKKILRYEIEWKKKLTPGFLIVVVEPDTSFTISFGKEINESSAIEEDRLFGIGGVSKVYTSIALAQAISAGEIDTLKKAKDIFSELNEEQYNFSILDLLRHQAGLPRVIKELNVGRKNEFEKVSEMEFMHKFLEFPPSKNKEFLYNHNDYALLDIWIKKESGKSIKEWYQSAQLNHELLPDWKDSESTIGLTKTGKEQESITYGIYTSSLGLYANSQDLEQLIRFLLADNELSQFIKAGQFLTDMGKTIHFSNGLYRIGKGKKYTIYGHGGRSLNNSASIHFVPETKTGLIILSNSETGTNQLYLPLLSMINNNWRR